MSGAKSLKNSPSVPQHRCFRLLSLSLGKVYPVGGNGSCIEEILKNYKDIIFKGNKCYVPQKILSKNLDPEYYDKEVK